MKIVVVFLLPIVCIVCLYLFCRKLSKSETGTKILSSVCEILNSFSKIACEKKEINRINLIISLARNAVNTAEQLYKSKQITADERKSKAADFIYKALESANINISSEVKSLTDDAIESAVKELSSLLS